MSSLTEQAAGYLADFEKQKNPELIQDAADRLQQIVLAEETDPGKQRALRKDMLEQWLALFAAIDASLDPRFNPDDLPSLRVDPPRSDGIQYPPGVDPSLLRDPAARCEYERRITDNRLKTESYTLQFKLRRLDERLMPRLEGVLQGVHLTDPDERREILKALQTSTLSPQRANRLCRLVAP